MDEAQEEMNGSTVFSKFDMNMGFHPIEIEEGSSDTTTFSAGATFYRYKTSSFGVNSAPEQYQNIFKQTITDCPSATNVADDIGRVFTSGFSGRSASDKRKSRENSCFFNPLKVKRVGKLQWNSH